MLGEDLHHNVPHILIIAVVKILGGGLIALIVLVGDYFLDLIPVIAVLLQELGNGGIVGCHVLTEGSQGGYPVVGGGDAFLIQVGDIGQGAVDNGNHREQDKH